MDKTEALEHKAERTFASAPQPPPALEAVREALDRVLSSKTFRAAEGQRNFLRYAVEQVLAGHGDLLKEYSVGIEVFWLRMAKVDLWALPANQGRPPWL